MATELGWNLTRRKQGDRVTLKINIYSKEIPPNKALGNALSYENKFLKHLRAAGEYDRVEIYINSGGGAIDSAWGMVQALYSIKKPGRILVDNYCGSAATMILCGMKCPAYMVPGGRIKVHMPAVAVFKRKDGKWTVYQRIANAITVNNMTAFYRSRVKRKKSRREIREWMEAGKCFTAEEALENGLIDGIMTRLEFEKGGQ